MSSNIDVLRRLINDDTLNLELNIERYLSCEMRETPNAIMVNVLQSQTSFTNMDIKNMITKIIISNHLSYQRETSHFPILVLKPYFKTSIVLVIAFQTQEAHR